ncbi:DNAJ domain containing protein [Trichophyton interdigitale]|uniref:DNAJ domain containing protein n=1 Tax=Trichophyton interdigitale TaxID=101480 RepID=A0A9P4YI25_9EURO|nr:DNAJ domain containing protein [Trichophyton interdigitale]KAF3895207.1 DNAJ domain containing protein [Trichophyton interdigitale]KAG8209844.1 DNAJ domain containing protein [Trichophyton interdigitale]
MLFNKYRLYVVLYVRGGSPTMPGKEDTYHWAFLVGPKVEGKGSRGIRYQVKQRQQLGGGLEWEFEERECPLTPTNMLLVRVIIGKILDRDRLAEIMRNTPVRESQPGWNCVVWVKEALESLANDPKALGTSVTEWDRVRNAAMEYCQQKKDQHRFNAWSNFDMDKAPTYDLLELKETII